MGITSLGVGPIPDYGMATANGLLYLVYQTIAPGSSTSNGVAMAHISPSGEVVTKPRAAVGWIVAVNDNNRRDESALIGLAFSEAEWFLEEEIRLTQDELGIERPLTTSEYYAMSAAERANVGPDEYVQLHARARAAWEAKPHF